MSDQPVYPSPKNDTRFTEELFSVAVTEHEDAAWKAIMALHYRGSRDVLERAEALCKSGTPLERTTGAAILGQLGVPERAFPEQSFQSLSGMLQSETDSEVLQSIATAFGHLHDPRAIRLLAPLVTHPDPTVRYGVVHGMSRHDDDLAIQSLITLSSDVDSDVRDWATFGLGQMITTDTPKVREALAARLDDLDTDTRQEAIDGLAVRKDRRALPHLISELEAENVTMLALEAAEHFADPRLLPQLETLLSAWEGQDDSHIRQLRDAIKACSESLSTHH